MFTIQEIAAIAYDWTKDADTAAILAAIDYAESAGDENAAGDAVAGGLQEYAQYACQGYLSFGLGQVFLGVHSQMVENMGGGSTPCERARWLQDPNNNMRAQVAILANSGFQAWSTYKLRHHERFLEQARAYAATLVPSMPPTLAPGSTYRPISVMLPKGTQLTFMFTESDTLNQKDLTLRENAILEFE